MVHSKRSFSRIKRAILVVSLSLLGLSTQHAFAKVSDKKVIRIASWNLWNFDPMDKKSDGHGRYDHKDVLSTMEEILTGSKYSNGKDYDVIFVQEIMNRDKDNYEDDEFPGFKKLCEKMDSQGYDCKLTPRKTYYGNDEGYGIIYKKGLSVKVNWLKDWDWNIDLQSGMVRPPMKASIAFNGGEYQIEAYNIHIKPHSSETEKEIKHVDDSIKYDSKDLKTSSNIAVVGDLNAACDFLDPNDMGKALFPSKHWEHIFSAKDYTNFANTQCAYDKIIVNQNMKFSSSGVKGIVGTLSDGNTSFGLPKYTVGNDKKYISDHKLIWAQFVQGGVEATDKDGNPQQQFMDYADQGTCEKPDEVFIKGEGFVPSTTVTLYVTQFPTNGNFKAGLKKSGQSYKLQNVTDALIPISVTTDNSGNFGPKLIWTKPKPGAGIVSALYNIVVDVNNDKHFTNSIDVVDVFNKSGFSVDKCNVKKKERIEVKIDNQVTRDVTKNDTLNLTGKGNSTPNKKRKLFSINNDSNINTQKDIIENLEQKSAFSAEVSFNEQGVFDREVTWKNPKPGRYNLILDMDNDDTYDPAIDVIDHHNQIGLIVVESREGHNDMVHLGDNGLPREVYNTGMAKNIYTLAKNLPRASEVDLYVISERLLKIHNPTWTTWESSKAVPLARSATPVYEFGNNVQTVSTSANGTLFVATWRNPEQIYDQYFIDYYGKKYNIVIDVNRDGRFDPAVDKVDTHDIGHMKDWFKTQGHLELSQTVGSGTPAVSEYKEYLNDKLDLETPLDETNIYDAATAKASHQYLCSARLTDKLFKLVEMESQVGIRVLNPTEYQSQRDLQTGLHLYDSAEFDKLNVLQGSTILRPNKPDNTLVIDELAVNKDTGLFVCNADKTEVNNIAIAQGSKTTFESKQTTLSGDIKIEEDATLCFSSTQQVILAGGATILAAAVVDPEPFSKVFLVVASAGAYALSNIVGGASCL